MKKRRKNISGVLRICIIAIAVLAQLNLLALLVINLRAHFIYIYFVVEIVALLEVHVLVDKNRSPSYTIGWVVIILVLPVFGALLYLLWWRTGSHSRKSEEARKILGKRGQWLKCDAKNLNEIKDSHPYGKRMAEYLENEGFPLFKNTKSKYYALGERQFEDVLVDLEKAQRFIFIETYILSEGELWGKIHSVLKRKAKQGVLIRLLYDDIGSLLSIPENLIKELENDKIYVKAFNEVNRFFAKLYINYRNHQKIIVIDGNIGYTGGTNLADEYANLFPKYGHWKDDAIRLEGDAVWSLTVTFLQMWEMESHVSEDYLKFKSTDTVLGDGFYQPFSDGPLNTVYKPAEVMYHQMVSKAREYVYITTPYLVVDSSMLYSLKRAAMSGVDVRIVTPKIWDRWYIHMITRSNYETLLEAGVRIYEYSPGYIHSKIIITDDEFAITGSINMDYRSFYLNYENAVWVFGAPVIQDIRKDITEIFAMSEEITLEDLKRVPVRTKYIQSFLRLFAPLL